MSQLDRLRRYFQDDPGNVDLACDLADNLLVSGEAAESLEVLRRLPAQAQALPVVRFRQARCALVSGNLGRASSILTALLADGVDNPAVRHDLAYVELMQGHAEAAATVLAPCLQGDVTPDAALCRLQARVMHWQHALDGALQWADRALEQQPGDAETQALHALILLDMDRNEEAARAATVARADARVWPDAELVIGTLALWSQRLDEAREAFSRAANSSPGQGRALSGMGQVLMLAGDIADATGVLERAVQAMPGHIGTWHALAWCRLLAGNIDAAHAAYDQAFALDRSFGETHGGFAVIHALRGEREAAEAALTRARRLDPNGRNAVYAQALLWLDEGRDTEAGHLVSNVLQRTPGAPAVDGLAFLQTLRSRTAPR
ncbi:tetratricopeptide repeat protein [Dyella ginsengisoli]|uniref:tetratricopeptide repeat protein n=1 Tax=Dyella ginsengisoli TaxID=363848 RepID=UPI00037E551C|nr:tetratricopeptide repeat protein [Dyella ginsengisoli]